MAQLSEDDRGKTVVMGDRKVGTIERVQGDTAYVDPNPEVTDQVKSTLDWGDVDEDARPIPDDVIDTITDSEVRLRSQM